MKRLVLALALLFSPAAFAQQANIALPSAPCVIFGTSSGQCVQGNDARLGAGAVTGAIKSNGANSFSQATCSDLSGVGTGCTATISNYAPLLSPAFTGAPTAPTVSNFTDSTTKIATTAFVQSVVNYSMATANLNIAGAGGTYSFASKGAGGLLSLTVNGSGVITAATEVTTGGTDYAVGDIISVPGGNNDAFLQVATLSGSAYATLTVLYGGTAYSAGTTAAVSAAAALPFTFTLSGAITGDVTFIMPNGPINQLSNQWIFNNNTTGAHKVSVFISNGSDTATGTGVVIPQGTANSAPTFIQTDGVTDVWYGSNVFGAGIGTSLTLTSTSTQTSGVIALVTGNYTLNPASASSAVAVGQYFTLLNTSNQNYSGMQGFNASVKNLGTGTVSSLIGEQITTANSAGGTITNQYGILVSSPIGATAILTSTWTNLYGINIQDQNPTGAGTNTLTNPPIALNIASQSATNAVAIQTGTGLVNFGGPVTVSTIYGGSAAGSTLALKSTSSGSPSGDSVSIYGGGSVRLVADDNGIALGGASTIALATSQLFMGESLLFTLPSQSILGNLYYEGGWKYFTNGPGGAITFANHGDSYALVIQVAPDNSSGANASASPVGALNINLDGTLAPEVVNSDATHTDKTVCIDSSTNVLYKGSGTIGICLGTSGRQFKNIIGPMQAGLDEVMKVKLWDYTYKPGYGDNGEHLQRGPTAQDIEAVLPDLVGHDKNGTPINYDIGAFIPILIHAVQQQQTEINYLKNRER